MTISADPTKIKEIKTNLASALAEYKGDLVFSVEDSYVGFVKPLKDRKNAAARNDTGRKGGIRQRVSASVYDNLRGKTDEKSQPSSEKSSKNNGNPKPSNSPVK